MILLLFMSVSISMYICIFLSTPTFVTFKTISSIPDMLANIFYTHICYIFRLIDCADDQHDSRPLKSFRCPVFPRNIAPGESNFCKNFHPFFFLYILTRIVKSLCQLSCVYIELLKYIYYFVHKKPSYNNLHFYLRISFIYIQAQVYVCDNETKNKGCRKQCVRTVLAARTCVKQIIIIFCASAWQHCFRI